MMESLSCIVPIYNEAGCLEPQLELLYSKLEESFRDFELILVNDGSTDQSGEILKRFQEGRPNVLLLDNLVNLNMGTSVQRGFLAAGKEFVTYNAADLPFDPASCIKCVRYMNRNQLDVLILEREEYKGATSWRKLTSCGNKAVLSLLFPGLKKGIRDTQYVQFIRKNALKDIMPLARSPIFTYPEMIFRARLKGYRTAVKRIRYDPTVIRPGAFGKPADIIWGLFDMVRFRIALWKGKI